jgi:hypothetical protein
VERPDAQLAGQLVERPVPAEVPFDQLDRRGHQERCSRVDRDVVGSLQLEVAREDVEGQQQVPEVMGLAPILCRALPDRIEVANAFGQLRLVQ